MAKFEVIDSRNRVLVLGRKEAVDLIGLLTAQLAGVTLMNTMAGACPSINVNEHGQLKERISISVERA